MGVFWGELVFEVVTAVLAAAAAFFSGRHEKKAKQRERERVKEVAAMVHAIKQNGSHDG